MVIGTCVRPGVGRPNRAISVIFIPSLQLYRRFAEGMTHNWQCSREFPQPHIQGQ